MKQAELIRKYNVAGPRYTSYPTVPAWDLLSFNEFNWLERVKQTFTLTNKEEGVSIYVHLPYCESLCTYCGCNTRITVNHSVEEPYIQAVLKEWSLYKSQWEETPRIREIHLGGGTPTFFSAPHLALLIEGLLAGCELAEDYAFSFEGHPSNTTREHLETLHRLGFTRVSFGIQDFDLKVQDAIHRMQSVAQVEAIT
ncbi:MAG: radical SAM protein, partial [Flavobacteriales bacterium]